MPSIISSKKNKHIKFARSLMRKKYRDITNHFLIEGKKIIEEAISFAASIKMIFISSENIDNYEIKKILNTCKDMDIPIYQIDELIFKEFSETESTQGIIGIVEKTKHNFNSILNKDELKLIVLEEIQDPGNLGTIIRTADACSYDCVALSKGCVDLYNSKTIRATMGSLFHLPIIIDLDIVDSINKLKSRNILTIGSSVTDGIASYNIDFKEKFALIIGNESIGLSQQALDLVDKKINIPMPGNAESLNASIAAAILMYESIRGH